jgi:chemotaxis protein methyltransferase CheR
MAFDTAADLSEDDYRRVQTMLKQHTGIDLADGKRSLAYSRLIRRLKELGAGSFAEYLDLAERRDDERTKFISALTTNVTDFFREPYHFEALTQLLPELTKGREGLSVWSSACSTGEEPWSIAMTIAQAQPSVPWKVLATDIDEQVLASAKEGAYTTERATSVSGQLLERYFQRDRTFQNVRVRSELRQHLYFGQLNLLEPWPMKGLFDVIFCRNVLIYFDGETRTRVVGRLANQLRVGGVLMLGHSEALLGALPTLEPCGKTTFRRVSPRGAS